MLPRSVRACEPNTLNWSVEPLPGFPPRRRPRYERLGREGATKSARGGLRGRIPQSRAKQLGKSPESCPAGPGEQGSSGEPFSAEQGGPKRNEKGKTILVVTHEEDIARMCKRIVRLKDGVIVEDKKITQKKAL